MKYGIIRNNARKLYRQNFKLYTLISLVFAATLAVSYFAATFRFPGAISVLIRFCAAVLVYPVVLGNAVFFYHEYLGGHGKFCNIFRFYRDKAQLVNALILGAIINLPNQLDSIYWYFFPYSSAKYPSMASFLIQNVPSFLILIAVLVFLLRTYPAPYIFGLKPQLKAFSIIKISFAKTKGYMFDYILFSLSFAWPLILAVIVLAITFSYHAASSGTGTASASTWLLGAYVPLAIFFAPYWNLCVAGFSWEIINNGDELQ